MKEKFFDTLVGQFFFFGSIENYCDLAKGFIGESQFPFKEPDEFRSPLPSRSLAASQFFRFTVRICVIEGKNMP